MSTPSVRFQAWIESLSASWKDRLSGWMVAWAGKGIEFFADILGKGLSQQMPELLDMLEEAAVDTPALKNLITRAREGGGQWQALLLGSIGGSALGGAVSSSLLPPLEKLKQQMSKLMPFQLSPIGILISLWYRKLIPDTTLKDELNKYGYDDEHIDMLKKAALFYPSPQDLITWVAKEVFEPDQQTKFGLLNEFDKLDLSMFAKAGVSEEQVKNYWIAHWLYPMVGQVFDMLHRGVIDKTTVGEYMRLAEYPPFWREKLEDISWDLPNRIELRMMARYGLVDKAFLLDILKKVGLHEDYRSIAADMMLVMGISSDISSRYSKGWITSAQVKSELSNAGLDESIQTRLYQQIVKQTSAERVTKEKELTKAEIVKGVKKGTITRTEGEKLISEMGYDAKEAKFIMDINVPVEDTVTDIKQREITKSDIINAYKLSQIDAADVISGLMSIRYSEDDARFLLNLTNATLNKIAEVKDRSLTKADIIKGVKNNVISQEEGYLMLLTIGYSDEDSIFILSVNPAAITGSPDTFSEFMAITQSYKESVGLPTKAISPEIIQAERDLKAAQSALKIAKDTRAKAKRLRELELIVEQAKQRYHALIAPPETKS